MTTMERLRDIAVPHFRDLLEEAYAAYPDAPGAASALAIGAALSCWIEQQPTPQLCVGTEQNAAPGRGPRSLAAGNPLMVEHYTEAEIQKLQGDFKRRSQQGGKALRDMPLNMSISC